MQKQVTWPFPIGHHSVLTPANCNHQTLAAAVATLTLGIGRARITFHIVLMARELHYIGLAAIMLSCLSLLDLAGFVLAAGAVVVMMLIKVS